MGITLMACLFLGACGAKKEAQAVSAEDIPYIQPKTKMVGGDEARAVLQATVFKMSGDYADNVAITLDSEGNLVYYPDPRDISAASKPVALADGWYLNRQGVGINSVFIKYTFDEYMALPAPPSHEELLKAIIPGAKVTEIKTLPLPASEAAADPSRCLPYLK